MKTLGRNWLPLLFIVLIFSCNRNISGEKEQNAEQNIVSGNETNNVAVVENQDVLDKYIESIILETESAGFPYLFVLEEVDVYDIPDMITGKVIYTLEQYEDVFLVERSVDAFEIDGKYELWYKITSPVVGWLFAAKFAQ